MGLWLKLGIGLIIALIAFIQYPEKTSDVFEKGKGLVGDVLDNETIEENKTISEDSTTSENNTELEKIFLGKPMKSISFSCQSDEDCVDSFCFVENGECYIYES